MAEKRFDAWPPVVPKVGQIVQVQVGDYTFEAPVLSRVTRDQKTFRIRIADPYNNGTDILLEITPSATGKGRIDNYSGKKPYWQIAPQSTGAQHQPAMLFFLD